MHIYYKVFICLFFAIMYHVVLQSATCVSSKTTMKILVHCLIESTGNLNGKQKDKKDHLLKDVLMSIIEAKRKNGEKRFGWLENHD